MNWQRILYGLLLILVGACVSSKPAPRVPRKPLFPKRRPEVKVVETAPKPNPAEESRPEPVVEAPKPKPVATGKWVLVQRPVYGGFRGRQLRGYQKVWQWQGPPASAGDATCSTGKCR